MSGVEIKKLKTIERLLKFKNEQVFDKINEILDKEDLENNFYVPKEHYDLLEEDHEKYLSGELSTDSYENVKARL